MKGTSIFFLFAILTACSPKIVTNITSEPVVATKPKSSAQNVIILLNDGMGLSQLSAGMYANANYTHLERFPVTGLQKPVSLSGVAPDEAAAATAIACGVITYNGGLGVGSDSLPKRNFLEMAGQQNYLRGIVSNESLWNVTPAAFAVHLFDADYTAQIPSAFAKSGIDLLVNAGRPQDEVVEGYTTTSLASLNDLSYEGKKTMAYPNAHGEVMDLKTYFADAAVGALQFLHSGKSQQSGFCLVVHSGKLAAAGRQNDQESIIREMITFDHVVGKCLDWAQLNGQTLVVVTSTYESGGYAINPGSTADKMEAGFNTNGNSLALLPVFAFGPASELFAGFYDNTQLFQRLVSAMGWVE